MSAVIESQNVFHKAMSPFFELLTPVQTRALAEMNVDASLAERIRHLADLANEGELTPELQAEYETYVDVNNLLAVLQAEARDRLTQGED